MALARDLDLTSRHLDDSDINSVGASVMSNGLTVNMMRNQQTSLNKTSLLLPRTTLQQSLGLLMKRELQRSLMPAVYRLY